MKPKGRQREDTDKHRRDELADWITELERKISTREKNAGTTFNGLEVNLAKLSVIYLYHVSDRTPDILQEQNYLLKALSDTEEILSFNWHVYITVSWSVNLLQTYPYSGRSALEGFDLSWCNHASCELGFLPCHITKVSLLKCSICRRLWVSWRVVWRSPPRPHARYIAIKRKWPECCFCLGGDMYSRLKIRQIFPLSSTENWGNWTVFPCSELKWHYLQGIHGRLQLTSAINQENAKWRRGHYTVCFQQKSADKGFHRQDQHWSRETGTRVQGRPFIWSAECLKSYAKAASGIPVAQSWALLRPPGSSVLLQKWCFAP